MFKMNTWQLIIVATAAVACVGYMSFTILRMLGRHAQAEATIRHSTPLETGLVATVPAEGERAFDGFAYRLTARYAGRVRVVVRENTVTVAGPRAPRGLYALWIWLQGLTLALVPPTLVLAAVKLDWRALLLALGIMIVSTLFMAIGAGVWPGMGETVFVGEGRFDATEIPLSAVRDVTIGDDWARGGMRLVIAPYAGGIDKLAKDFAVCFDAPDGAGHDASWGIHMLSKEDALALRDLLATSSG